MYLQKYIKYKQKYLDLLNNYKLQKNNIITQYGNANEDTKKNKEIIQYGNANEDIKKNKKIINNIIFELDSLYICIFNISKMKDTEINENKKTLILIINRINILFFDLYYLKYSYINIIKDYFTNNININNIKRNIYNIYNLLYIFINIIDDYNDYNIILLLYNLDKFLHDYKIDMTDKNFNKINLIDNNLKNITKISKLNMSIILQFIIYYYLNNNTIIKYTNYDYIVYYFFKIFDDIDTNTDTTKYDFNSIEFKYIIYNIINIIYSFNILDSKEIKKILINIEKILNIILISISMNLDISNLIFLLLNHINIYYSSNTLNDEILNILNILINYMIDKNIVEINIYNEIGIVLNTYFNYDLNHKIKNTINKYIDQKYDLKYKKNYDLEYSILYNIMKDDTTSDTDDTTSDTDVLLCYNVLSLNTDIRYTYDTKFDKYINNELYNTFKTYLLNR